MSKHPVTAQEAARAGYLVAPANYEGKTARGRYVAACAKARRPALIVAPRRKLARVTLDAGTLQPTHTLGEETTRRVSMAALRAIQRHRGARGTVTGGDVILADNLPLATALELAQELARILGDPGAIVPRTGAAPASPKPRKKRRLSAMAQALEGAK